MAKPDRRAPLAESPATPTLEHLGQLCELLEKAGAQRYVAAEANPVAADEISLMPGVKLSGGPDESSRAAAAKIIRGLYRAEEEIRSLSSEIVERYEEATLVYRVSERLGEVLGEANITRLVLEDAANVLGAESAEFWLRDGDKAILAASMPPSHRVRWEPVEQKRFVELQSGQSWVREAAADGAALVAVPLPNPSGDPLGILVMRGRRDNRSYRSGEVKLLMALAAVTSAFIRNHRLAEHAKQAEAQHRWDKIAQQIHGHLLGAGPVTSPELEVSISSLTTKNLSADHVGHLEFHDGAPGLVFAGVSGHGVGAAMHMAATRATLRTAARNVDSPAELLQSVHEEVAADATHEQLDTSIFLVRFDCESGEIQYSGAGRHHGALVRADGSVEVFEREEDFVGHGDGTRFEEGRSVFRPGDLVVLYTPGLVEARNAWGEAYGCDRVIRGLIERRKESGPIIVREILAELSRHTDLSKVSDNAVLLVARRTPVVGEARA